jgi:hypothetical protein
MPDLQLMARRAATHSHRYKHDREAETVEGAEVRRCKCGKTSVRRTESA